MNNETIFTLRYTSIFLKRDSLNQIIDYIIEKELYDVNFEIIEWDLFRDLKRNISSDIFNNQYFKSKIGVKILNLRDEIDDNNSRISGLIEEIEDLKEENKIFESKIETLLELVND